MYSIIQYSREILKVINTIQVSGDLLLFIELYGKNYNIYHPENKRRKIFNSVTSVKFYNSLTNRIDDTTDDRIKT